MYQNCRSSPRRRANARQPASKQRAGCQDGDCQMPSTRVQDDDQQEMSGWFYARAVPTDVGSRLGASVNRMPRVRIPGRRSQRMRKSDLTG
jgi:hypothetical protein